MKRLVVILLLIISFFSFSSLKVLAANNETNNVEINYLEGQGEYANCDGLFTQEGLDIIKEVLNWIRIIAPILLILLVALDFSSAVLSQDNGALAKAAKKVVPRMIGAGLLFFVPTIVRAILSMDGIADSITIPDDPLCHTMAAKETINYEIMI